MSGAMIFIKEELGISDTQQEVLAGILNICALFGSLAAGRISDYVGRRYTISMASILFMLGAILMGYGPNYAILMTGRCVAGVGVGFALMIAPVYSAEISSAKSRGLLTSLPELCIELGWRLMLGVAAIPSLALAIGILFMPESPRWLVIRGHLPKAKKVLLQISNTKQEAENRFNDIKLAAGIGDENNSLAAKENQNGKSVSFFNIGLGPVTWVYSSEIFPLRLRAQGASIGVAVNRVMNATVSMSFISIYKAITIGGAFFMFSGISIVAWLFFYFFMPETKGKALEEMEMVFTRKSHRDVAAAETHNNTR
ncbi:hypothetical protein Ahy_Scaffold1g106788 isoform A [Arachis hypogaea]|uniref:Major facilitator superfamily (MFS) profile domain-containing protein n=1 Tax=Arachis hypogaea TaxID=3818 RepID=A0A444WS58_ARAHY|nr:hypothetical protein Ahy_Scaffold1g106788 isoform A [Arachis hypogaea]